MLGLRMESKLRIAGMPTEHLFSLNAWFKLKQMFGWHPCDSELGSNDPILRPKIGFLNMDFNFLY